MSAIRWPLAVVPRYIDVVNVLANLEPARLRDASVHFTPDQWAAYRADYVTLTGAAPRATVCGLPVVLSN